MLGCCLLSLLWYQHAGSMITSQNVSSQVFSGFGYVLCMVMDGVVSVD